MINLKKAAAALMVLTVSAAGLAGCGAAEKTGSNNEERAESGKTFSIVCTSFPQYDFVNQILGDNPAGVDVTYLLGSGVDMHNYQASAEDMIKIKTSDLFIYIGGESDQWAAEVVQQNTNDNFHGMALIDLVEAKEEVIVEGMEYDHDHDHDEGDHDHGGDLDEHVWLSLRNAMVIVDEISAEICRFDPEHRDYYQEQTAAYKEKLSELDGHYEAAVNAGARDTILVADRFPFRYLADDYGLTYYAAFPGCSAETEASFDTVVFLAEKVGQLKLATVLIIDGSDGKIANTVVANSTEKQANIKTLNSIQSVSSDDMKAGVTYLGIMEENLNILKEALN